MFRAWRWVAVLVLVAACGDPVGSRSAATGSWVLRTVHGRAVPFRHTDATGLEHNVEWGRLTFVDGDEYLLHIQASVRQSGDPQSSDAGIRSEGTYTVTGSQIHFSQIIPGDWSGIAEHVPPYIRLVSGDKTYVFSR